MQPFHPLESEVRSYCRAFPTVFHHARGATLVDAEERAWLDLFAGAGALNYGHNPPEVKAALLDYLAGDGVTHALDMMTTAKTELLDAIEQHLLLPRSLEYRVLFPGPTGTNAVEAALKLARKATGRTRVIGFSNGFHGMTLGALSVTGNAGKRAGAGLPLTGATSLPFEGDAGPAAAGHEDPSLVLLERMLANPSSGLDKPAAVVVEAIQGEGGCRAASPSWLRRLRALTRDHGVLLIVDDIQAGCGRSGAFFSFEEAGIVPDIVTLSKSLSGMGLPLSLVLLRPALDVFSPGEHNGTFRGFNPAFVTATAALRRYWADDRLARHVRDRSAQARARLQALARGRDLAVTGRGLLLGLRFGDAPRAGAVARRCFETGVIVETAGAWDEVLKLMPPLTITEAELGRALDIVEAAVDQVLGVRPPRPGDALAREVGA